MNGEEIGFIAEFLLQATLFRLAAVSVLHTLAEPRLPGESQHVAVKITVLRGDQRIRADLGGAKQKGNGDEILPEHFYS